MVTVDNGAVEFNFFRPQATQVFLTGDFNDWRKDQIRMVRRSDGYWTARLKLPGGTFKFRYLADGQWFNDYAAFGLDVGAYGLDSVVVVAPQTYSVIRPAAAQPAAVASMQHAAVA